VDQDYRRLSPRTSFVGGETVANPKRKQFMVFVRSPLRRDDPVHPHGTSLLAIRESTINLFAAFKRALFTALILLRCSSHH